MIGLGDGSTVKCGEENRSQRGLLHLSLEQVERWSCRVHFWDLQFGDVYAKGAHPVDSDVMCMVQPRSMQQFSPVSIFQ